MQFNKNQIERDTLFANKIADFNEKFAENQEKIKSQWFDSSDEIKKECGDTTSESSDEEIKKFFGEPVTEGDDKESDDTGTENAENKKEDIKKESCKFKNAAEFLKEKECSKVSDDKKEDVKKESEGLTMKEIMGETDNKEEDKDDEDAVTGDDETEKDKKDDDAVTGDDEDKKDTEDDSEEDEE